MEVKDKTRIVIITDTQAGIPGGSERHLLNFITHVSEDIEIKIIQLNPDGENYLQDGYFKSNVEIISYQLQSINSYRFIPLFIKLVKLIYQFKPEVIASYHEKSDILNYLLRFIPFSGHSSISSKRDMGFKLDGKLKIIITYINSKFDLITAPSNSVIDKFVEDFGAIRSKTKVVYNGVDLSQYKSLSQKDVEILKDKLGIIRENKVIISIGWLREGKGHEYLIRGFSKFSDKKNWNLVILGEGPDRTRLEAIAKECCVESNLVMPGIQRNVHEWLAISDIIVSASFSEGLSNALVEGLATGLPIIATKVGGNPEVVDHNTNGILIEPKMVKDITDSLEKITQNDHLYEKMKINSRMKAESTFSINSMVNKLEVTYKEISGKVNAE